MLRRDFAERIALLVATAYIGNKDTLFKAYKRAMKSDYRMFAYGDAMMVI